MTRKKQAKMTLYIIFAFLLLLLIASFILEFGTKKTIEPERFIVTSDGNVLKPPFSSSLEHPFGTDKNGNDLLTKLVIGFKYTFFISIVVTFFRLIIAFILSMLILFYLKSIKPYIETFLTPFLYVPAFLLFIFLARGEETIISTHGEYFLIFYQMLVMILIGIPPLISLLISEFEQLLMKDYVIASQLLGASNFHLATKQIFPAFKKRFYIVFVQQTISSIILLIYLGVFQLFIGGKAKGGIIGEDRDVSLSKSSEWGGMIGQSIFDLVHFPWLTLYPAAAVVVLILLLNIVIKEVEKID